MKNLFLTDTSIPEGYEYLLDVKLPSTALSYSIAGIIVIIMVMIALTILTRKKEKSSLVCICGGISIFALFNYFLVMIVNMFVPTFNVVLYMVLSALIASVLPFIGRLLVIKLFARKYNGLKEHLGYGVGIMEMKAITSIFVLFVPIFNYIQIADLGVAYFFPKDLSEEIALKQAESLVEMLKFDYSQCMLMMLISLGIMVYQLAVSLPIYAAYSGKKSKGWYAFALGTSFLVALCECLYNNDIFVIPSILITLVIAGVSVYFAVKLYKEIKPTEPVEEVKKESDDIGKNAHVKIPRFQNLDKL